MKKLFNRPVIHFFLIAVLGILAYANTFNSPFVYDDRFAITDNPVIKDLGYFVEPSKAKVFTDDFGYFILKTRYTGYLSFALNYKLHGLDVTGYHVANLLIHIINALLVYFLIVLLFKTPLLNESSIKDRSKLVALSAALLFITHPMQTETVTFTWQRVASLAAMFYLLSIIMYIKARLPYRKSRGEPEDTVFKFKLKPVLFYLTAIISAVFAMKTKELSFTLPVIIVILEFLFFNEGWKKRALLLLPFIFTMLIIPLSLVGPNESEGILSGNLFETTRRYTYMPRTTYLFTQFSVIVKYLSLIFIPAGQNLDHDHPVYSSFIEPNVFLPFILLCLIFSSGIYILYRYRETAPWTRLISFGIFWFFITISVESGIVPIVDVIAEHRVYLPSAGLFMLLSVAYCAMAERLKNININKAVVALPVVIIIALTGATYARNNVWKNEITLWQDVVKKSPNKARGHYNLGSAYQAQNLLDKAIISYETAIKVDPLSIIEPYYNLALAYRSRGLVDKAIEQYITVTKIKPDHYQAHTNLGLEYKAKGLIDKAIEHYIAAIRIKPDDLEPHYNLGNAYMAKRKYSEAVEEYKAAIRLRPDLAEAYLNMGNAYKSLGLIKSAKDSYSTAVRLRPGWEPPLRSLKQLNKEK